MTGRRRKRAAADHPEATEPTAPVTCPACGTPAPPGAELCPNCGSSLKGGTPPPSEPDASAGPATAEGPIFSEQGPSAPAPPSEPGPEAGPATVIWDTSAFATPPATPAPTSPPPTYVQPPVQEAPAPAFPEQGQPQAHPQGPGQVPTPQGTIPFWKDRRYRPLLIGLGAAAAVVILIIIATHLGSDRPPAVGTVRAVAGTYLQQDDHTQSITLAANGAWTFRGRGGPDSGTYRVAGSVIRFLKDGKEIETGRFSRDRFTDSKGLVWVKNTGFGG